MRRMDATPSSSSRPYTRPVSSGRSSRCRSPPTTRITAPGISSSPPHGSTRSGVPSPRRSPHELPPSRRSGGDTRVSHPYTFDPLPAPVVEPGEFVFSAVGLAHGHVLGMTRGLLDAGATLRSVYDAHPAQ